MGIETAEKLSRPELISMICGLAGALWAMAGLPPMPWYGRIGLLAFMLVFVYASVSAVAAFITLKPGYYGMLGLLSAIGCIPITKWASNALSDPEALIKRFINLRGGKDGN
jgi:hypothetical protein